eukprot:994170-Prorocentrum_minimum.AAC.1
MAVEAMRPRGFSSLGPAADENKLKYKYVYNAEVAVNSPPEAVNSPPEAVNPPPEAVNPPHRLRLPDPARFSTRSLAPRIPAYRCRW